MTLNAVIAIILHHFTEFGGAHYITVVEVRPILCDKNVAQKIYF